MSYILNNNKQKIHYKKTSGKYPTIIFIHGLNSDMNGKKAITIEKYAKKNKISFVRFDCRGHGKSYGKFENFNISDWKQDLLYVIDNLTKGPVILVGSSIGGWLMMLAAKVRPSRIKGMIGLAAAPDCDLDLFNSLTVKNKKEIKKYGITKYSSYGFNYILKKNFFTESKKNRILDKSLKFTKPLILIHGLKDEVVSKNVPEKILKKIKGNRIKIIYLKNSDHRLSKNEDLNTIKFAIDSII
tara:strand:- start:271 stop:996 length:726 start_codon:yes stop_codon:yes gene_type:complete